MKELLDAAGLAMEVFLSFIVKLATLPCDILNISDYWAIVYIPVAILIHVIFRKRP